MKPPLHLVPNTQTQPARAPGPQPWPPASPPLPPPAPAGKGLTPGAEVGRRKGFGGAGLTTAKAPALMAPSLSMSDWNDYLGAMKARLMLSVEGLPQATDAPWHQAPAQSLRSNVLESMAALEHLHATLRLELEQRLLLEMEVCDAQAALAQAHAELAGTPGGARQARHMAGHDALTALPNRSRFCERLDQALASKWQARRGVAVLYLDLDGFKPIDHRHGHAIADEVLRIVALRLTRAVRTNDMVSRFGGDVFACLVADTLNREQLARLACKIFDAVSAPLTVGDLWLNVSPSIGIAACTDDCATAAGLLQLADTALDRAKRTQSGFAFHDGSGVKPPGLAAASCLDGARA